jgi:hypothetical protein
MTDDQLDMYNRLTQSAGLIKVFDGTEWLDLRLIVREIVAEVHRERGRANRVEHELEAAHVELDRAAQALDSAHAEVQMLGALLREG